MAAVVAISGAPGLGLAQDQLAPQRDGGLSRQAAANVQPVRVSLFSDVDAIASRPLGITSTGSGYGGTGPSYVTHAGFVPGIATHQNVAGNLAGQRLGVLGALPGGIQLIHPVASLHITSPYGWRNNPTGPGTQIHVGQDYAVPCGSPVYATADGVVVQSAWAGHSGMRVTIDHGSSVRTGYSHNSRLIARVGDTVRQGQVIALSGTTGNSTGCHVHFEVIINGRWNDPRNFLPPVAGQPNPKIDSRYTTIAAEPIRNSEAPHWHATGAGDVPDHWVPAPRSYVSKGAPSRHVPSAKPKANPQQAPATKPKPAPQVKEQPSAKPAPQVKEQPTAKPTPPPKVEPKPAPTTTSPAPSRPPVTKPPVPKTPSRAPADSSPNPTSPEPNEPPTPTVPEPIEVPTLPVPDVEEPSTDPANPPATPDDEPQSPEQVAPEPPDADDDAPVQEPQADTGNGDSIPRETDSDSQATQEKPAVQLPKVLPLAQPKVVEVESMAKPKTVAVPAPQALAPKKAVAKPKAVAVPAPKALAPKKVVAKPKAIAPSAPKAVAPKKVFAPPVPKVVAKPKAVRPPAPKAPVVKAPPAPVKMVAAPAPVKKVAAPAPVKKIVVAKPKVVEPAAKPAAPTTGQAAAAVGSASDTDK